MVLKNFDQLVEKVKSFPEAKRVIVAAAGTSTHWKQLLMLWGKALLSLYL